MSDDAMLLLPIRHVVRLVLEAATPLSIASGEVDADLDCCLMRDWNGLPCLPGTAIAGVLRALHEDYATEFGAGSTAKLFGFIDPRANRGQGSRLMVSFGLVHDKGDCAVEGYLTPDAIAADPVLRWLAADAPLLRDRVALDERGVARDSAKFDRTACPVGTRFSVELALDGSADDKDTDARLLAGVVGLLSAPYARFGGATRSGFGHLAVVRAHQAAIDRRGVEGRASWLALRQARFGQVDIDGFRKLANPELAPPPATRSRRHPIVAELKLQPKGFWRMGQGNQSWTGEKANQVPLTEPVILWNHGRAAIVSQRVTPVPAAGIKGALAHRAEFHLRRLRGQFVGAVAAEARRVDPLFGSRNDDGGGGAGALLIDDASIDFGRANHAAADRTRNSIDRHSGGVRLQVLFTDQALWRERPITLRLVLLRCAPCGDGLVELADDMVTALDWALADLCEGRLAIGAGGRGGDGVMASGELTIEGVAGSSFAERCAAAAEIAA